MQDEVEGDLGERCIQVACAHFRRVGGAAHFRDQTITRGKGEVVVQVFVAINVDLRRQLPIAQCADEEVDVRGRRPCRPSWSSSVCVGPSGGQA